MQELDAFFKICEETIPEYHRFIEVMHQGLDHLQIQIQENESEMETRLAALVAASVPPQPAQAPVGDSSQIQERLRAQFTAHIDQLNAQIREQKATFDSKLLESIQIQEKLTTQIAEHQASFEARSRDAAQTIESLKQNLIAAERASAAAAAAAVSNANASSNASSASSTTRSSTASERSESKRKSTVVYKVLVVDDAEINRVLMGHYFKPLPVQVEFSNSGEDAVQRCQGKRYDLIIMDLQMKGMSGVEASQKIRDFEKATPIIALTNEVPNDSEKENVFAAGCNEYLGKGAAKDTLLKAVSSILHL